MIDLSRYISAGDGVWWGQAGAEPEPLVNALLEQVDAIGPLRAFCGLTWNDRLSGDLPESLPDGLTVLSYGGLGDLRLLSRHGLLDVVPCHYSAIPRMFAAPPAAGRCRPGPGVTAGPPRRGHAGHRCRVHRGRDSARAHADRRDQPQDAAHQGERDDSAFGVRGDRRDRPAAARGAVARARPGRARDRRERGRAGRGRRHGPDRCRVAPQRGARGPRPSPGPRRPHRHDHGRGGGPDREGGRDGRLQGDRSWPGRDGRRAGQHGAVRQSRPPPGRVPSGELHPCARRCCHG